MSKRQKTIPKFSSEAAERKFWEVNDSTEYLDWGKARPAAFPNLKPSTKTISLRLPSTCWTRSRWPRMRGTFRISR